MPNAIKITQEQHAELWNHARVNSLRIDRAAEAIIAAGLLALEECTALPVVTSASTLRRSVRPKPEHSEAIWAIARRFRVRLGAATEGVFAAGLQALSQQPQAQGSPNEA